MESEPGPAEVDEGEHFEQDSRQSAAYTQYDLTQGKTPLQLASAFTEFKDYFLKGSKWYVQSKTMKISLSDQLTVNLGGRSFRPKSPFSGLYQQTM